MGGRRKKKGELVEFFDGFQETSSEEEDSVAQNNEKPTAGGTKVSKIPYIVMG